MTGAGFPHSDIHGSKLGRQLPVAFRSLPRPSSVLTPRHPPLALCSLELYYKDARARYEVLKGRRRARDTELRRTERARAAGNAVAGRGDGCTPSKRKRGRRHRLSTCESFDTLELESASRRRVTSASTGNPLVDDDVGPEWTP